MKTKRSSIAKRRSGRGAKTKPAGKNGTTSNLQRRYKRLERERDSLRRELAEAKAERLQLQRSLVAAMDKLNPPPPPPTLEEAMALIEQGPSLRELVDRLEKEMESWDRNRGK